MTHPFNPSSTPPATATNGDAAAPAYTYRAMQAIPHIHKGKIFTHNKVQISKSFFFVFFPAKFKLSPLAVTIIRRNTQCNYTNGTDTLLSAGGWDFVNLLGTNEAFPYGEYLLIIIYVIKFCNLHCIWKLNYTTDILISGILGRGTM